MKRSVKYLEYFKIKWFIPFIFLMACVDPIEFDVPEARFQTVVEGMISDGPGPYTVKVSNAWNLNADSLSLPVQQAKIKLYDDEGNEEGYTEISPGLYSTTGTIQGREGHSYFIKIETSDGTIFQSEPDKINPSGEIQEIRYEFEARTATKEFGDVTGDVFNIYVDAINETSGENYVRWRFNGTFKVITNPELNVRVFQDGLIIKDPLPCSGYVVLPALGGGKLTKVEECTCCTCWVSQYETQPRLSDAQLISGNLFKNVKIAEIPINQATFYDKYNVTIEQLSLSRTAYDFFKLIRTQKEGASNLFQPPSGEIRGNIKAINTTAPVVGLFYASSIKSKSIYIARSDVPYPLPTIYFDTKACTDYYRNSTTVKPKFWE